MDPVTGLLIPNPQSTVLLTSQSSGPVPSNHFLHPETGKVLHVTGNVGYDPITSRLVCTVDSASGKVTGIKEKKNKYLLICNFKLNKKTKTKGNLRTLLISMGTRRYFSLAKSETYCE